MLCYAGAIELMGFPASSGGGGNAKRRNVNMKMKTLGKKNMVRMILRFGVAVVLLGIPAISAVADGPGQVPYPKIVPIVQR